MKWILSILGILFLIVCKNGIFYLILIGCIGSAYIHWHDKNLTCNRKYLANEEKKRLEKSRVDDLLDHIMCHCSYDMCLSMLADEKSKLKERYDNELQYKRDHIKSYLRNSTDSMNIEYEYRDDGIYTFTPESFEEIRELGDHIDGSGFIHSTVDFDKKGDFCLYDTSHMDQEYWNDMFIYPAQEWQSGKGYVPYKELCYWDIRGDVRPNWEELEYSEMLRANHRDCLSEANVIMVYTNYYLQED